MTKSRVYADFHNSDSLGRVRLNCVGTFESLAKEEITFSQDMKIILYNEELEAEAFVVFSEVERIWVAIIDWDKLIQSTE